MEDSNNNKKILYVPMHITAYKFGTVDIAARIYYHDVIEAMSPTGDMSIDEIAFINVRLHTNDNYVTYNAMGLNEVYLMNLTKTDIENKINEECLKRLKESVEEYVLKETNKEIDIRFHIKSFCFFGTFHSQGEKTETVENTWKYIVNQGIIKW